MQQSSFVQILDYPSLPLRVSNPQKTSTLILGGLIGFFLAIGLAFITEYFTNTNETEALKLLKAKKYAFNPIRKIFSGIWLKKK